MRKYLTILAVSATLASLAACGDPDVTTDEAPQPVATVGQGTSSETPDEANADEAVQGYMDALATTDDPEAMRDGLQYAAEGSTAHVYLQHRANLAEAALDGGQPVPAYQLDPAGDGFKLCHPYDTADCGIFADFKAADGKVTDLTVDGEEPGPRLTAGNGDTVTAGGVTAEFLTAYDAVAGSGLWVTARVTSGSEAVELSIYTAVYRAPDGKQRDASDAYGPYELGADSNAMVTLVFAGVEPGGAVSLTVWDEGFNESVLEIQVG